jgi:hypothetical protein
MERLDTMGRRWSSIKVDLNGRIVGEPLNELDGITQVHLIADRYSGNPQFVQLSNQLESQLHIHEVLMEFPTDSPLFDTGVPGRDNNCVTHSRS